METTGRIVSVQRNYVTGRVQITIEVDQDPAADELRSLVSYPIVDVAVRKHREKRTLSANAYFHVLVSKIATAVQTSNVEVKNRLIREYGAYEYIDEQIPTFRIKAEYEDEMLNRDGFHVITVGREVEDGVEWVRMALMRGSHTYNTAEMSRLIDGAVEEAKELGIETMTPAELERMKASWNTGQSTA